MARTNARRGGRGGHRFSEIPAATIQRSSFRRDSGLKTTLDAGYLVPVFVEEVLPGDTHSVHATWFGRITSALDRPAMENIFLDSFFFFVPYRLVWDNWVRMMGEQDNPGDSTDFLVPIMTAPGGGYAAQSLSDYLGIRTQVAGLVHTSLCHRAYNLIYNTWFRSEDLQDSVTVDKGDGPDDPADYVLLRRGKRHDYFTSALPFPQKGPAVDLPLGLSAPVIPTGDEIPVFRMSNAPGVLANLEVSNAADAVRVSASNTTGAERALQWDETKLLADLTGATAATVNQLREAIQIQRLFERDARGGTRYTEILRSHFGVISPDARLQRPEFLGGGSVRVQINPVATTVNDVVSNVVGALGAYGTLGGSGSGFVQSFVEHGVILGLVSVRADLTYQQGLPRMFSRRERFDFYWPALAHLGEQAVLNKEIFAQATAADDQVFGYQERWAEYRYRPSVITGKFRSDTTGGSFDNYHLAQDFAALPVLDENFIVENPPFDRIVAVPSEPDFLLDAWFNVRSARPMPVFSVPGMMDHF